MPESSPTNNRRAYRPFALAAVIYTVGVVTFSAWAYFEQRATLLTQVDESLVNATHATQTIIGHTFISTVMKTEAISNPVYSIKRADLDHYATDSRFDLLMAIAVKGTNLWTIIGGVDSEGVIAASEAEFMDPVDSGTVATVLRTMVAGECEPTRVLDLHHKPYGQLRIGVRYESGGDKTGYALVAVRNIGHVESLMRKLLYRTIINGCFLLVMAFPLAVLYNRARVKSSKELADVNKLLEQDIEIRKKRETELEDAIHDLERFNTVTIGRESRILELKAEVNTLLEQAKRSPRYNIDRKE